MKAKGYEARKPGVSKRDLDAAMAGKGGERRDFRKAGDPIAYSAGLNVTNAGDSVNLSMSPVDCDKKPTMEICKGW